VELITIGAILGAVHAPVAVVASGVVVDVVEGHGEDISKRGMEVISRFSVLIPWITGYNRVI